MRGGGGEGVGGGGGGCVRGGDGDGVGMWRLTEEDDACLQSLCQGIVDVSFKQPRRHSAPGKVCE